MKDIKFNMLVPSYENECTLKREVERKEEKKEKGREIKEREGKGREK